MSIQQMTSGRVCPSCGGWVGLYSTHVCQQTQYPPPTTTQTHIHYTPPLSEADVERIAKRVIELLDEREREGKP